MGCMLGISVSHNGEHGEGIRVHDQSGVTRIWDSPMAAYGFPATYWLAEAGSANRRHARHRRFILVVCSRSPHSRSTKRKNTDGLCGDRSNGVAHSGAADEAK